MCSIVDVATLYCTLGWVRNANEHTKFCDCDGQMTPNLVVSFQRGIKGREFDEMTRFQSLTHSLRTKSKRNENERSLVCFSGFVSIDVMNASVTQMIYPYYMLNGEAYQD